MALAVSIPTAAHGQPPDAVFGVNYYANIHVGLPADATVRVTNPGTIGASSPSGDLCALIYVFTADQQMAECCGCPVTPNGLRTLSVTHDLTSNPLTGETPTTGAIKIISSTRSPTGGCDAASPTPTPQLIAWATHIQPNASAAITETAFEASALSIDELGKLKDTCGGIIDNGSGYGVCTCGTERPPISTTSTTVTTTTTRPTTSTSTSSTVPPLSTTSTTLGPNHAPDCTRAVASPALVWPPNHAMVDVGVAGVVDQDGDPLTLTVTSIRQDEPSLGPGSGNTCSDADGIGTPHARVRAERSGLGDGRVYHVRVRATDSRGASCVATVEVCVPHDQGRGSRCVDEGPLFDSTGPCLLAPES